MGVLIDTPNAVPAKHLVGPPSEAYVEIAGFTSGNLAGGKAPTELSAAYFDALTAEIANASLDHATSPVLAPFNYTQLADSIDEGTVNRYPTRRYDPVFTFRTQDNVSATALGGVNGKNNRVRERTKTYPNIPGLTTVSAISIPIPEGSHCLLTVRAQAVKVGQTAIVGNYSSCEYRFVVRNYASVLSVITATAVFSETFGPYTWSYTASGATLLFRLAIAGVGTDRHNCFAHYNMINCCYIP